MDAEILDKVAKMTAGELNEFIESYDKRSRTILKELRLLMRLRTAVETGKEVVKDDSEVSSE